MLSRVPLITPSMGASGAVCLTLCLRSAACVALCYHTVAATLCMPHVTCGALPLISA